MCTSIVEITPAEGMAKRGDEWFPYRAAINHWHLVRTDAPEFGGWRITKRTNRLLRGDEDSYAVMREGSAV